MSENKPDAPWMVFGVGGNSPVVEHPTEERARSEAARLARLSPGQRFRVVQVVCEVVAGGLTVKEFERDPIPF